MDLLPLLVTLAMLALLAASGAVLFAKAREPGWAAVIPVYNLAVACKIAGKPLWWVPLCIIPPFALFGVLLLSISLARSFGKGMVFGVVMVPFAFIFLPLLAFSDAKYQGPAG